MNITIDRSKWVNGKNKSLRNLSMMLNEKDNMCCLGHICKQMGVIEEDLEGSAFPPKAAMLYGSNLEFLGRAYEGEPRFFSYVGVNDNETISEEEREKRIQEMGREDGLEIEFINTLYKELK